MSILALISFLITVYFFSPPSASRCPPTGLNFGISSFSPDPSNSKRLVLRWWSCHLPWMVFVRRWSRSKSHDKVASPAGFWLGSLLFTSWFYNLLMISKQATAVESPLLCSFYVFLCEWVLYHISHITFLPSQIVSKTSWKQGTPIFIVYCIIIQQALAQ